MGSEYDRVDCKVGCRRIVRNKVLLLIVKPRPYKLLEESLQLIYDFAGCTLDHGPFAHTKFQAID